MTPPLEELPTDELHLPEADELRPTEAELRMREQLALLEAAVKRHEATGRNQAVPAIPADHRLYRTRRLLDEPS